MKYHYILSAFSGRAGWCKSEVNLGHYPWAYSSLGRQRSSLHISLPCEAEGFPRGSEGKESTCNARDPGSIPESGKSSGEGTGNPLQYSCLENPMDRGAWRTPRGVPGVAELDVTERLCFYFVNKFFRIILFDSAYKCYHLIFAFLWLSSLSMIISRFKTQKKKKKKLDMEGEVEGKILDDASTCLNEGQWMRWQRLGEG